LIAKTLKNIEASLTIDFKEDT